MLSRVDPGKVNVACAPKQRGAVPGPPLAKAEGRCRQTAGGYARPPAGKGRRPMPPNSGGLCQAPRWQRPKPNAAQLQRSPVAKAAAFAKCARVEKFRKISPPSAQRPRGLCQGASSGGKISKNLPPLTHFCLGTGVPVPSRAAEPPAWLSATQSRSHNAASICAHGEVQGGCAPIENAVTRRSLRWTLLQGVG